MHSNCGGTKGEIKVKGKDGKPRTGRAGGKWKTWFGVIGAVAVAGALAASNSGASPEALAASAPVDSMSRPPILVRYSEAKNMKFHDSISADGELKSRFYVLVSPRISGTIDDILVREGSRVEQGASKLFQIDSEKLRQSVEHAQQSLVIARSTLDEKKAGMTKAKADLAQAEKDYARNKSLYEQKVIPLAEFEVHETKVVQLEAQLEVAETNVTLAEQNVTLSEITLRMSEKDLRDSIMYAPIDGVISARYSEPGEMGSPGKSILRIDGSDELKAVAYLPGQFFPRIDTGTSIASVFVLGRKIGDFPVTYKAPGIDSALRTFEIWADIPGDGRYAVFGAQCVITVVLREASGVGVPRDAVQYRDGKYWVFMPNRDVARMVEVKPGLETDEWTELIDSPLSSGDKVITPGQFLLEEGYPIRERGL